MKRILIALSLACSMLSMTVTTNQAASDLVGNYHLDEGEGEIVHDSSGSSNHGRIGYGSNAPEWIAGKSGSGVRFKGSGYIVIPDSEAVEPRTITVEAWVRNQQSPGRYAYILSKGAAGCVAASYGIYTGHSGGLFFYIYAGSAITLGSPWALSPDAGIGIWDGEWHHVAGIFDQEKVRLYIDGIEVGTGTQAATYSIAYGLPTNEHLYIGGYGATCGFPTTFVGDIDEVKIWARALSACEITRRSFGD